MTATDEATFIDIFAKIPLETVVTLASIVSSSILTSRVFWAEPPIGTFVNVKTARDVFHQVKVRSDNSFMSMMATTDIASYCVCAVQLSLAGLGEPRTLVNVDTVRFDP